jgi:hypothetical protein
MDLDMDDALHREPGILKCLAVEIGMVFGKVTGAAVCSGSDIRGIVRHLHARVKLMKINSAQ